MSRLSQFNNPLLLGFEELAEMLDNLSKSTSDGFPPYNIEHLAKNTIRISLAVAGFTEDELEIVHEDNQLLIRGRVDKKNEQQKTYLHRGIAARQFSKKFILADTMQVTDATLENGLLHVTVTKPEPEVKKRVIKIG